MDYGRNFRAPTVDVHQFTMVPKAEIPRSQLKKTFQHKATFNASLLIPIYLEEVLPGDTISLQMTGFARMSTPVYPLMDNIDLESFFFYVPARILWMHWKNFQGEQPATPSDSISYTIPVLTDVPGSRTAGSVFDYMGIPTQSMVSVSAGAMALISAIPFRAYNMIWNEWFKDQNLQNAVGYGISNTVTDLGDGPDPMTNYTLLPPGKRHDYFTSSLPWTQKGNTAITLPLGTQATVKTSFTELFTVANQGMLLRDQSGTVPTNLHPMTVSNPGTNPSNILPSSSAQGGFQASTTGLYPSNLYADLSTATAATINQLRMAFQTQRLLERDARSGTRYVESLLAHWGVRSPDYRQQRPEYLGGGKSPINIAPVPQTTGTGASGTTSALGTLAAVGTAVARGHGFNSSFTEHGYIIGLICARNDEIYQNGLRRLFTRSTRYDFYLPVFANLGEQSVFNYEIYTQGTSTDLQTFAYQEHWAEYRYQPSQISGAFRSTYAAPLDAWHTSNNFTSLPALNAAFIQSPLGNTMDRILAAGATARTNHEQFIGDFLFNVRLARCMPMYSVPGNIDKL